MASDSPRRRACFAACPPGPWTPERVGERFDEAAATLRQLRMVDERLALGHLQSSWPEPTPPTKGSAAWWQNRSTPELTTHQPLPSSEAIDAMDETLGWLRLAEWPNNAGRTTKIRTALWLRARGWRWHKIAAVVDCSERHARALRMLGLALIATRLNSKPVARVLHAYLTSTSGR